jgi:hypothetical protein
MTSSKDILQQGRDAAIAVTDPSEWRHGKAPDYHFSRERMPEQRMCQHAPGSLAAVVEGVVQVFEMEISFKPDSTKWLSVVQNRFKSRVNGGPDYDAPALAARGSYNVLIGESPFYSSDSETFESSHDTFRGAFPEGFVWEVVEVYSPPPVVTAKWRHWGDFPGPYKGFAPTNQRVEMYGLSVIKLTDDLQILEVEHFYDNNRFLAELTGGCPVVAPKR